MKGSKPQPTTALPRNFHKPRGDSVLILQSLGGGTFADPHRFADDLFDRKTRPGHLLHSSWGIRMATLQRGKRIRLTRASLAPRRNATPILL